MASLSALANFLGEKDRWKATIARYGLHWSERTNNIDEITEMIYTDRFTEMPTELRKGFEMVPEHYSNYVKFDALTGLRPAALSEEEPEEKPGEIDSKSVCKMWSPSRSLSELLCELWKSVGQGLTAIHEHAEVQDSRRVLVSFRILKSNRLVP